jgi:hypothetical protein
MQKVRPEKKAWNATGLSLFSVFAVFDCALASLAAGQTLLPPLLGQSGSGGAYRLRSQSGEGMRLGKMVMNDTGTLLSTRTLFGRDWASHSGANLGAVTLSTNLGDPFARAVHSHLANQEKSYALGAHALQREVFETALSQSARARPTVR